MRKALLIMGLAVTVFAVGCSDNISNGGSGDSSGKTGTTLVEEAEVDEVENSTSTISSSDNTVSEEVSTKDLSTMIPNPNDIFTAEEISFNNYGDLVTGSVKNAERSEFDTYKQKCKDAGFDTVDYDSEDDSGSLYMGYNNDKSYKVRLFFSKKDNSVEITLETENN